MNDVTQWILDGFLDEMTTTIEPTGEYLWFTAKDRAYRSDWELGPGVTPDKPWSFWHTWWAGTIGGLRERDEHFRVQAQVSDTHLWGHLGSPEARRGNSAVLEVAQQLNAAGWFAPGKLETSAVYQRILRRAADEAFEPGPGRRAWSF